MKGVVRKRRTRGSSAGNQEIRIPSPSKLHALFAVWNLGESRSSMNITNLLKRRTGIVGVGILTGEK